MTLSLLLFINGFAVSLGLITVIGVQNAFVLKQAILKKHILIICAICILTDAVTFTLGINVVGIFLSTNHLLDFTVACVMLCIAIYLSYSIR
jgi:L-lysine exporter family protein LysE/ArgO